MIARKLFMTIGIASVALIPALVAPSGQASIGQGSGIDVRFNRIRLQTGVTLHYAEVGPADGEVVIMLHGVTDSWFSFSRVLPLLPLHIRAYVLDQRGHGDSERPATGYAPRDLAADVIAFMNAQRIERATIVGHSMGSYVAQQVVLAAPDRVARLVLIGSSSTPRTIIDINEINAQMQALKDPVPVEFIRAFQESTVHVPVPAEFMERVIAESRKLPARVWHGAFTGMMATDAAPPSARRIPTLILWGDREPLMPRAEQDALIAQYGTALLRVYPETGHAPHWERPEDVARDLALFLRGEPAPIVR